jgi:feruloyl esterase
VPRLPDQDAWWGNDEAYLNFGNQGIKKTKDAAVWVMQELYGVRPSLVYFGGQSAGGREALMAATHYPDDYAGISATAGVIDVTSRTIYRTNLQKLQFTTQTAIPAAKVRVIRDETLRQCDNLDGLADGVINNYADCAIRLDHTITPNPFARIRCPDGKDAGNHCLSDAQITLLNAIRGTLDFGFPLANGYSDVPGWGPGQEIMITQAAERNANLQAGGQIPKMVDAADMSRRYPTMKFDLVNNPFSAYKDQLLAMSKATDVPTDWTALLKSKTKVIWHAIGSDPTVHGRAAMRVYEEGVKRHGQAAVDRSLRFYVTPQGDHGARGFSATTGTAQARYHDLMGTVINWVEKGIAPPEYLISTHEDPLPPYTVMRSRPLCRYPRYPRYKGSGSSEQAANYTCAMPQAASAVKPVFTQTSR